MQRGIYAIALSDEAVEGGLVVRGSKPQGFQIAGRDGRFVPAVASVDGGTVVLFSPEVPHPTQARYGWANDPQCNLFNHAGLPASPFRTARP